MGGGIEELVFKIQEFLKDGGRELVISSLEVQVVSIYMGPM